MKISSITSPFQSTPSWRGRPLPRLLSQCRSYFNPRPREEGDFNKAWHAVDRQNFNPRPREEGDAIWPWKRFFINISIHALVKRATQRKLTCWADWRISIHALVKRATGHTCDSGCTWDISIHALVKRATRARSTPCHRLQNFNPRPREEGDTIKVQIKHQAQQFQSTPSWRGRPSISISCKALGFISIHALVKRATWLSKSYP